MGKYRMQEPWGYQDTEGYQGSKVKFDNILDSFFADSEYDSSTNTIHFFNKDGEEVVSLDISDLKTQDLIESAKYEDGYIVLKFSNGDVVKIDVQELLDENEFEDGLQVVSGVVSVLIDPESDEYITVSGNGIKLSGVSDAIKAEYDRAVSAETELKDAIDGVMSAVTSAETSLREALNQEITDRDSVDQQIWAALGQETNDRSSVDTDLWAAVNGETERAQQVEKDLWDGIAGEATRAQNAESDLWGGINGETSRAQDVEGQLWTAVNGETTRAQGVEKDLWDAVNNETERATSAESVLWGALNDEVVARGAAIKAEMERATKAEEDLQTQLGGGFNVRNTVEDNVNRIDSEIESLASNVEGRLKSVTAANSSVSVDNTDKVNPVIGVNISTEVEDGKGNIIKLNADGLYAAAELTYNEATNTLKFSNTNGSKEIALVSNSLVDRVFYDANTESIIIEYTVNGVRQPDVIVPARDLIDEIDVQSTSTVSLTKTPNKTAGPDIITADVKLSEKNNLSTNLVSEGTPFGNLIEVYEDGLYASIDVEYINGVDKNTLVFKTTKGKKEVNLVTNADIKSLVYNKSTEELELTYGVDGVEHIVKCDVSDLIEEWDVVNPVENAVVLTKTRSIGVGHDTLSADVKISAAPNNILQKLGTDSPNGGGTLYVDGSQITANATAIEAEKSRAETKEGELETAIKDNKITFTGSNSVSFTTSANENGDGNVAKADVKVSTKAGNIIGVNTSGVYATVDLTYDKATNDLTFTRTNPDGSITEKVVALHGISIFESMEYDDNTKSLVLKYYVINEGDNQLHSVTIPLEGLFNDYDVKNPVADSAIELIKTENDGDTKGYFSAKLIISDQSENIAKVVDNSLYVDGRASNIKYENTSFESLKDVKAALDKLFKELTTTNGNVSDINGELAKKADKVHEHTVSDISDIDVDASGVVLENNKLSGTVMLQAGQF